MTEAKPKPHRVKINLTKKQKQTILKHFDCDSLSRACRIALASATGVRFPPPQTRTGKAELLVFDLENNPLYSGKPVTRKTVQGLLCISRAAAHLIVKEILKDSFCIRQGYVLRLADTQKANQSPTNHHRSNQP